VERRWNERPIDTPILIVLCLALESPTRVLFLILTTWPFHSLLIMVHEELSVAYYIVLVVRREVLHGFVRNSCSWYSSKGRAILLFRCSKTEYSYSIVPISLVNRKQLLR
jgi:hypothetical protein